MLLSKTYNAKRVSKRYGTSLIIIILYSETREEEAMRKSNGISK
jgi:hypothetical protein